MGNRDKIDQLEFFSNFCDYYKENKNESVDFKSEVVLNRDHDNNFLINWQDGLEYFYKDWKPEKIK